MNRLPMSRAAAGLLRALIARAGDRDRILLTEIQSTNWESLTFVGERHEMRFNLPAPGAQEVLDRMLAGLETAEFTIPGQLVADIAVPGPPVRGPDGSISFTVEALTVRDES